MRSRPISIASMRWSAESADLARLVRSPVFTADEQIKALTAVLDKAGIGGLPAQVPHAW